MAQNEIVNILRIETKESQKTIKELKSEISKLKKEQEELVIGSKSFEKTTKELTDVQNELKNAIKGNTQTVEDAEGSYNALVAEMAKLKKEWRATADEFKRNQLGKQIDIINDKLKGLDATIGNNQRLVGSYAEEFEKAMKAQQDSTIGVRAKLEGLQKVASGLASGYAAVQGTMTLLNIESAEFEKAMIKIQSAMAIAQGVGGLKDMVEGVGQLKTAFETAKNSMDIFGKSLTTALPIALLATIIASVGALVGNMDKLKQKFVNITPEQKAKSAMAELNAEISKSVQVDNIVRLKQLADGYRALGDNMSAKENYIKEYTTELNEMGIAISGVNDADKVFIEKTNDYVNALMLRAKAQAMQTYATKKYQEYFEKRAEAEKKLIDAQNKQQQGTPDKTFGQNLMESIIGASVYEGANVTDAQNFNNAITENIASENVKKAQAVIDDLDKNIEKDLDGLFQQIANWINESSVLLGSGKTKSGSSGNSGSSGTSSGATSVVNTVKSNISNILSRITKGENYNEREVNLKYNEKELAGGNLLQLQIDKENELMMLRQTAHNERMTAIDNEMSKYQEESEEYRNLSQTKLDLTNEFYLKRKEYLLNIFKYVGQMNKKEIADEKNKTEKMLSYQQSFLSSMATLIGQETAVGKAAAVASAIIDTYKAANNVMAEQAGGLGIKIAAMAAVITAGLANVKSILSVNTDVQNTAVARTPRVNIAEQMPIQYTRELMTDSETTELNKEQKIYVTEQDISDVQEKVSVRDRNSTF